MQSVIAYLSGVVREVRENSAVVVAGGVGYEVQCPTSTLAKLVVGQNAEFNTALWYAKMPRCSLALPMPTACASLTC